MSSQTQKRKHKTLTIKEKCDILDRLNRNETFSSLASEYGVGRSTIYDVKKKHEKIKKFVSTTDCGPGKRQTLKKAEHPEVEEALYMWFLQERNRHAPISGPMLAMKAKFFYKEITKKDDFVASKGWLERFKSRHGIRLMTITGEKLSNDATCIEPFKLRFLQKVNDLNLDPSQVYNADESGLFWRVMPNKTFVSCNEKDVPGRKVSKERVTILPCANAAGTHALKMVVIGKSNKPRAFKNIDLPVHYYGQKSAWMTKDLFKKWFDECFVPESVVECVTVINYYIVLEKLWPDIITTPSNDPQISVTSEVIEQVATETQISPEDLEVWCRGMDKEENVCLEMSDEDIIKEVSNNTTNDQEDNDDVIATAPQVTDQDAVNAFELGLQWAEENGTSYNELLLLRRLRDKALISRYNNLKQKKLMNISLHDFD
ncbi:hypothetical protein JTB14_015118 [Gonioctena quinquepunctata]|nr:hypothetical protein JTB14_015118 [Gonioctena quinquepunctata]